MPLTLPYVRVPANMPSATSHHEPVLPFADSASDADSESTAVLIQDFHVSKPSGSESSDFIQSYFVSHGLHGACIFWHAC